MKTQLEIFDETALFERELEPVLDRLHDLCDKHNIPYAVFVQYGQQEDPADPADRTRATMCVQNVTVPERTCPLLQAIAMVHQSPRAAAIQMMVAAAGVRGIEDQVLPQTGHA